MTSAATTRSRRARHRCGHRGLTLVEVTLATALVAVAVTSLLGLLSLALASQAEARLETRAAFIAGSIISDLRQGSGTDHGIPIRIAASGNPERDFIYPTPATIGSITDFHLLYSADGHPLSMIGEPAFTEGLAANRGPADSSAAAGCMVRIRLSRARPDPGPGSRATARTPPLYHIGISVQHPAIQPEKSRQRLAFFTCLNLDDAG